MTKPVTGKLMASTALVHNAKAARNNPSAMKRIIGKGKNGQG
jgi:hypothetical protein